MQFRSWVVVLSAAALMAGRVGAADSVAPDFAQDVAPLLKVRCVRCHGPAKREGELSLALPSAMARGGENGAVVVAGQVDESLLWRRVAADEMPPEEPLSADEKATLRAWIAAGAPGLPREVPAAADGDEHWAFQKLQPPAAPDVRDAARVRTSIDRFVLARLEAAGLSLSPEADRATLIRRVAFDLTGLPPTPDEIETFSNDPSDTAYEAMVERYLASPHYGERWGKYWLDAAGYADSNGYFGADTNRHMAYRYRDYVIRSINADKPFDQFLREQIAGDEMIEGPREGAMSPRDLELLEATHFLRNSPDGTDSSDGNPDEVRADRYAVLEGTLQIFGSSLLGITVQCSRCHDHKFEPFTQRDYYQLQAVIYPAFDVENWLLPKKRLVKAGTAEQFAERERTLRELEQELAVLRETHAAWVRQHREHGQVRFFDSFDNGRPLAESWSNTVPGDAAPAGQPAVNLDSEQAPGANAADGALRIVESRDGGDRALSTRRTFDWTPEGEGDWIQVTFDLVDRGEPAPYVAYLIALRDFNDSLAEQPRGGNVLIDGSATGKNKVDVDYPGADRDRRGSIGESGYKPGHNYGVRITKRGDDRYELAQVVDGLVEEGTIELSQQDLPDGGFGFEYCCGRSFVVDNLVIETGVTFADAAARQKKYKAQLFDQRQTLAEREAKREKSPLDVALVTDLSAAPSPTHLLGRGDYKSPQEVVGPAAPQVLGDADNPADLAGRAAPRADSTGRRTAFATWLTRPGSRAAARLARVTVNRWWAHHFGEGIVATTDNLGYSGAAPAHGDLLEHLAAELVRGGWSGKQFHRLIVNSAVYRQSSAPRAEALAVDPSNRLLGRFPLRRLDAEAIRDAMLAASGRLDTRAGGPYVPTKRSEDGDVIVDEKTDGAARRSVYLQQRRTQVVGMLEVFDAPSIVFNCTFRAATTVPLQSLKLMNSDFVRAQAEALAKRTAREAGPDAQRRLDRAFLLTIGRPPAESERSDARAFLEAQGTEYAQHEQPAEQAWIDFCQALFCSSPFLYVP